MAGYGPRRCKLPRKPAAPLWRLEFYYCEKCGNSLWSAAPASAPVCCDRAMAILEPEPDNGKYAYEITGGFDRAAVLASWTGEPPQWLLLHTFTGFYLRAVAPGAKPPIAFPLAGEDAYAYCGREICEKCLYACKKGCSLYAWEGGGKLVIIPLDQIGAYFKRGAGVN